MNEQTLKGHLIVKVSTANGAIPLENVSVIIRGVEDDTRNVMLSLLTDRNGLTPKIDLPAPKRSLSESPNPASKPYTSYAIDVYKEGYYPQHYSGVPIFEGITALQNAILIPNAEFDSKDPFYTEEQDFNEYENPNL